MEGVEWLAGAFDFAGAVSIAKQRDVCLRPAVQITVDPAQAGEVTAVLESIGAGGVPIIQRAGRAVFKIQSIHQAHALAVAMAPVARFKRDHWQTLLDFVRQRLTAASHRTPFGAGEWAAYRRMRQLNGLPVE